MAVQNLLIMKLLRIITPEEIADIATKHNGGKFLSLTNLVSERVEHKIYRDFSGTESVDEIHEAHAKIEEDRNGAQAKILPFNKKSVELEDKNEDSPGIEKAHLSVKAISTSQIASEYAEEKVVVAVQDQRLIHKEDENMSSFILIEKARLKNSQKNLKQREIIDLYQKNSNVDVEQIKSTNNDPTSSSEVGVLVNKKRF